jgi:hypothetical protein
MIQMAGTGSIATRWDQELFLQRMDEALQIVRQEPASARRARVEPLLDQFSITNMVRLATGEKAVEKAISEVATVMQREAVAVQSEAR